jgi:hypothetical protein
VASLPNDLPVLLRTQKSLSAFLHNRAVSNETQAIFTLATSCIANELSEENCSILYDGIAHAINVAIDEEVANLERALHDAEAQIEAANRRYRNLLAMKGELPE